MLDELSRLEWHKKAHANLCKYLAELEAAITSGSLSDTKPAEHLITVIKRRLEDLERLITEAEQTGQQR